MHNIPEESPRPFGINESEWDEKRKRFHVETDEKFKQHEESTQEMLTRWQRNGNRMLFGIFVLIVVIIGGVLIVNYFEWVADVEACMRFQPMYTRAQCEDYLRILRN